MITTKLPIAIRRFTQRYKVFDHKIQHSDIVLTEETLNTLSQKVPTKYEFEGVIAHGGMKTIMRLRDKDTARNVAMATLLNQDSDLLTAGRFIREARITANLEHPNIIPIHEIGVDGKSPYFIMKLIEGETLLDIIEKLRAGDKKYIEHYTLSRFIRIFRQVVNAIVFAHARGVIHLDLSPGNILVGKYGEVLVLDWGLAQVIEHSPEDSRNDSLISDIRNRLFNTPNASIEEGIAQGTPGYMSPEQASGEHASIDLRSDIYALGAILYTILTLSPAVTGVSIHEIFRATQEGRIIPPKKKVKKHIPNSLNALVMKAMQKNPNDRYQTVTEIKEDLDAYVEGRATLAENASWFRHAVLFAKRHMYAVIFASLLLITFTAYGSYILLSDYMGIFHWGAPVYKIDLRSQIYSAASQLNFTDSSNKPLHSPFIFNSDGYIIPPKQFIWLPTKMPYFDTRVTFELYATRPEFEIFFGANNEPLLDPTYSPSGFIVSFKNQMLEVSFLTKQAQLLPFARIPCKLESTNTPHFYAVAIQTINNVVRIYINNVNLMHFENPFPIARTPNIGIRAGSSPITLTSARIRQVKPDDTVGTFVIPELLITRNRLGDAIDYYIQIAENSKNLRFAHHAILRALAVTTFRASSIEQKQLLLDKINKYIENDRFEKLRPYYHMCKADLLWQKSQYESTIQAIKLIEGRTLRAYIAAHLLNYKYPAPASIVSKLKAFIAERDTPNENPS